MAVDADHAIKKLLLELTYRATGYGHVEQF